MRESADYVISVVKSWQNWGTWNEAQRAILEDVIYHLEQAERVRELEDDKEYLHGVINKASKSMENLIKQNKRYREALDFYADSKSYAKGMFEPPVMLDG